MTQDAATPRQPSGRLRADKHVAIMRGGCEVFAREGFERASIGAIASAANVSTRTIYKHFADKAALFAAVIADSAAQVAEEETALIEHRLSNVTDAAEVQPALEAFATEWLSGTAQSATHRALIRQVRAEAAHLGPEVVTVWWQAGPGRVIAALAAMLARWSEIGLLEPLDAERAAVHFSELVSATPGPPGTTMTAEDRRVWIADGVRVFVRAYRR